MKSRRGLTLMEVLLAMLILSTAIVTILPQLRQAARMSRRAKNIVTASQIASNFLQELQLEKKIEEGKEKGTFDDFEAYSWETEIEKVKMKEAFGEGFFAEKNSGAKEMYLERLYRVKLRVFWGEGKADESYEMHTLLFQENQS